MREFLQAMRYFSLFLGLLAALTSMAQEHPKRELRAAWIATVSNIDWPSKPGLNAYDQQAEYTHLLDILKGVGMNAVIVQVRPTADAFYPSSYEPWSEFLTGQQGKSPEPYYNPLAFMIAEAHKRCMEFHAWFNPYRVSIRDSATFAANHPFHSHPEWFVKYGGRWYYDPGHPGAQEYVLQTIIEIVRHYDLDAVHFDDYFYPYRIAGEVFPDSCSYQDYGQAYANIDDWRRSNVDFFVRELSARIKQEKPHVKFGISPFGVWRNDDKDPEGSRTRAGQTNYDDLYADVLKWLKEGWIDYVTPQLYWHIGFEVADYSVLVDWWSKHSYGRQLFIGQAAYRIGRAGWEDPDELANQIALNRTYQEIGGSMYFSAKVFAEDRLGINAKMKSIYPSPALVPAMSWIDTTAPSAPTIQQVGGSQTDGVMLSWADTTDAAYYVVYRFQQGTQISADNPANITAIVPRQPSALQSWRDATVSKRTSYIYGITAVDRTHNESELSPTVSVRTRGRKGSVRVGNR
nr:MAG: hypothetical protein DIU61_02025 [Bacteroidota bacterium]